MKTIFHRILATTALCLAAMGLSSCYSTLHQYAWQRAKVVDDAWFWKEDSELFRVGDKVYAKVYHGVGRGTYEGGFGVLCMEPGAASFSPIEGKVKPFYVRLNAFSCAEVLNASARDNATVDTISLEPHFPPLSQLPESAAPLAVRVIRASTASATSDMEGYEKLSDSARTDAHKYYAYPLGGLMAVAVDAPLSLAMTVTGVTTAVVVMPIAAVWRWCSSNETMPTNAPAGTQSVN